MQEPKTTLRGKLISRRHRRGLFQRGFVLILMVMMITVLLGLAGLSIDLGNWYLHIQQAQRASDSAALDGDPWLPDDVSGARNAAHQSLLEDNVPPAEASAAFGTTNCNTGRCIRQVPGKPTQLEVRIHTTATNYFLRALGVAKTTSFSRHAIADYTPGLEFNSGDNGLGGPEPNDGSGFWTNHSTYTTDDNYWLAIAGAQTSKVEGDRFADSGCLNNGPGFGGVYPLDGCPGGTNKEYNTEQYNFDIRVEPKKAYAGTTTGYLQIEAYDPAFNDNPGCTFGSSVWCPSDEVLTAPNSNPVTTPGNEPTTYYNLYPNPTSTTPIDTCSTFAPAAGAPKWQLVCNPIKVDLTTINNFYLRVTTGNGVGINHFMLRAGITPAASASSMSAYYVGLSQQEVTILVDKSLSIFDETNNIANFRVAQIPSAWAGQTIQLQLYDVGDQFTATGTGVTGTISLAGPAGISGNCTYTPPSENMPLTSFSPASAGPTGCGITVDEPHYNGQLVYLNWKVPASYRCKIVAYTNCWLYVRMDMNGLVLDDTTWSMEDPGQPLRIIR